MRSMHMHTVRRYLLVGPHFLKWLERTGHKDDDCRRISAESTSRLHPSDHHVSIVPSGFI